MTAATAMSTYVERSIPFEVTRATEEGGDGLTFEGYGAVFNTPTRIDSWEGCFDEQIAPGAFKKTLRERTPVLQFDHGRHPLVGSIPIGAIRELREDDQGLFVQARLSNNWLVQPVREAIANGSISGMSFRFEPVKEDWHDANGRRLTDPEEIMRRIWSPGEDGPLTRTLREVKMFELGPVVFPAYPETTAGVRSQARELAAAISADNELRRSVRAALAASKPATGFELREGVSSAEIARALLFDREVVVVRTAPSSVPGESNVDTEQKEAGEDGDFVRQHADDMIHTSDVGTSSGSESTEDSEANRSGEPLSEHSETRTPDEPPAAGHSEPDAPPTSGATPPLSARGTNLDAEERRLARLRRAEAIRGRLQDGLSRSERYINV